jgi:hypothetical protein
MPTARLLLLLLPTLAFAAEHMSAANLQLAGNERGLVERMARSYAWQLIEPASNEARLDFANAGKRFGLQLGQLSELAKKDSELNDNYSLLSQQWADFQALTKAAPSVAQAKQVLEASEDMAWIAQKGGQLIEAHTDAAAQPALLAENVATLSQRLAKDYLMQSAGLTVPFLSKDLATARTEFEAVSRQLKALPQNSPSIKSQIELMDTQWLFFQQALDALANSKQDATLRRNVVTTSNRIYEVATELSARYQKLTIASAK